MKKIILVVILALGFAFTSQAQTPVFQKGTKVGSVGVGFGSYGIPVELSMMWGVYNNVFGLNGLNSGVGAYLGISSYNETWLNSKYHHTIFYPGVRGQLNYTFVDNLEVYGGLLLGFMIWSSDNNYGGSNTSGLGLGGYAGLRYYFKPNLAVYLEGGYGITNGTIGISYKF
ncbi:MAG: hypothetical protein PHO12_07735 [Bacteroidales bacterium]|nr:hypothetical protein [Bacteroidales bacterium]MDD4684733.1 hypothetical protein [Bacteroidales bacterium]